ncbi:hypothetical protein [Dactylosporangium sp. NPDC048998]|uniref:hypothetical protein n=1 Tax=Dactylosporangium sp. NPDC048998 TaxID=3363976 RepID=UPI003721202F
MDARGKVTAAGTVFVLAGALLMAAHDVVQEAGLHFADLAGGAHVRLSGGFDAGAVAVVASLRQVASAECDDTLYGVTVDVHHDPLRQATVVTAAEDPELRSFELRAGRMPVGPEEVLLDEATADHAGARLGDRVVLSRGRRALDGRLVGIGTRPGIRAVGAREPVAMVTAGGIRVLAGTPGCELLLVRLHDEREALAFADAVRAALPGERDVAFDNGVRHSV